MPRMFLLCAALALLSACGQKSIEIAVPPPEWLEPAPEPQIPPGDTDAEVAQLIIDLHKWGSENRDRILRLKDWAEGVTD